MICMFLPVINCQLLPSIVILSSVWLSQAFHCRLAFSSGSFVLYMFLLFPSLTLRFYPFFMLVLIYNPLHITIHLCPCQLTIGFILLSFLFLSFLSLSRLHPFPCPLWSLISISLFTSHVLCTRPPTLFPYFLQKR